MPSPSALPRMLTAALSVRSHRVLLALSATLLVLACSSKDNEGSTGEDSRSRDPNAPVVVASGGSPATMEPVVDPPGGGGGAPGEEPMCVGDDVVCPGMGCVDLSRDESHCGSCGVTCGAGEACQAGACLGGIPLVSFVTPLDGSQLNQGERLDVEVNAEDDDGIAKVSLYIADTLIAEDDQAPYSFSSQDYSLLSLLPGAYELRAVATDVTGAQGDAAVRVDVISDGSSNDQPLATDVRISQVAIYQATKIPLMIEGEAVTELNAPLIANRPALVRVFVEPLDGFVEKEVSAKLVVGEKERFREELISEASTDAAPQSTLNFFLSADEIIDAQSWSVSLHEPDSSMGGGTVSPRAMWPLEGEDSLSVKDLRGGFRVTFVPLIVDGTTAKSTAEELAPFVEHLYLRYPLDEVEFSVREPYEPEAGGWQSLVVELADLRQEEGGEPNDFWYGLVPGGASGVQGISFTVHNPNQLHPRASVGRDADSSIDTFAHEIGHALGRQHAPCGTSGEGGYPYSGASIGAWGYNLNEELLIAPDQYRDYMSYCDPEWTSDYTYAAIAARIEALQEIQNESELSFDIRADTFDRVLIAEDDARVLSPRTQNGTNGAGDAKVTLWFADGRSHHVMGRLFTFDHGDGGTLYLSEGSLSGATHLALGSGTKRTLSWEKP